jgi:hypothetical protein
VDESIDYLLSKKGLEDYIPSIKVLFKLKITFFIKQTTSFSILFLNVFFEVESYLKSICSRQLILSNKKITG